MATKRDFVVKNGLVVTEGVTAASLDISGDVDVDGTLETDNLTVGGQQGTDGQVLTSTGSGVQWENAASGTSFPLEAPDGSAAAPSYTFSSDTNTGIFRENNDNISFSCGGTRKILFTTDGIKMVNGQIQADGSTITSGGGYTFGGDTDTGMEKYFANQLTLRTAGSPRFTIGSSGEIRIGGTTSGNDGDAGTSGQVLTSAGGSSPPTWETPSGGGASALNGLTDVISNITNFTDSILISPDGAAPPTGTLSSATGNLGIGKDVLSALTSGDNNVAYGHQAGSAVNSGSGNITIGYQAGDNITSGSNNLVIGGIDTGGATNDSQIRIANGDGSVTWIAGDENGIKAHKIKVVPITGTTQLTDAQSGSYVYVTSSGVPTLPDTAELGQQYTIINNKGSQITVGLGSNGSGGNNTLIGTATVDDDKAKTFVAVATNTWFAIG